MQSTLPQSRSSLIAALIALAVWALVVPTGGYGADLLASSRADLVEAIRSYHQALERLQAFNEAAVQRAASEVAKRRDLVARGVMNQLELEQSERALEAAEAKLEGTRREIRTADQALSEALADPVAPKSAPPPQPRPSAPASPRPPAPQTQQPPRQKPPRQSSPSLLAWADAQKPGMPARLRSGALSPSAVFKTVEKSVYVLISSPSPNGRNATSFISQGSAVAVTSRVALTNCHVIAGNAFHWLARDDVILPVKIAYGDPQSDRCAITTPSDQLTPIAGVRPYSALTVGERVYTVGSPSGLENTLGEGIVSGLRRRGPIDLVQTTAPMSPGSSGGGLFDSAGNLVGITTFLLRDTQNVNFAIAAETFWK